MTKTLVFIIGAGPTGLAAGAALTRLGIKVRIIDKNAARSVHSKALGMQAGTLECLGAALGENLAKSMLAAGRPAREANLHINGRAPITLNLGLIPSRHNFVLILAQSETERILEEYLEKHGVSVERQTELLNLNPAADHVTVKIKDKNGAEQEIQADFVLGADGAHSRVRQELNIPFDGYAYPGDFIVSDVRLDWPWSYDVIRSLISERGVLAGFPLPGSHLYRLVLIPSMKPGDTAKTAIDLSELRTIVSNLSGNQITIHEATWMTRFRIHHRMADRFQQGRVFLAGDAAHIHSPIGGQGMNTGIQDALSLAFKLREYFAGERDFSSLQDYERERLPVAKKVLHGTNVAFKLLLARNTFPVSLLWQTLLPCVIASRWVQRRVATALSEVKVARRQIQLWQDTTD